MSRVNKFLEITNMLTKADFIMIIFVFLSAVFLMIFLVFDIENDDEKLIIEIDKNITSYDVIENSIIEINDDVTGDVTHVVEIDRGEIFVSFATCKDNICMKQKIYLNNSEESNGFNKIISSNIACLPYGLLIYLE